MPTDPEPVSQHNERSSGLLAAVLCFVSWGLVPVYWKQLQTVPSSEILAHRLLWSFAFSALLLSVRGRWNEIARALRSGKQLVSSVLSGAAICLNWFIFIWAVNSGYVIQTSLGYFITPLVNILLGALVFREQLRPLQWTAIALAGAGVLNLSLGYGSFPWIALSLCASFALYGLLRKTSRADSLPGLFLESAAMVPFALAYIFYLQRTGTGAFSFTFTRTPMLLIGGGIITALPLLWFAHAARNLKLSTLGLLQYLGPSMTFLLGVLLYKEPFTRQHLITFSCIWAGLAIFSVETHVHARRKRVLAEKERKPMLKVEPVGSGQ